ncbi:MAG: J domain-containing protein, partial [Deltaproteobacteria bacterium]
EAGRLFETDWKKLKQMDARTFTRLYRRLAMKHHPDQGGHKRKFIKLTSLYRHLMRKKRN